MRSRHYDIVRKDYDRSAIWLEAVSDLHAAESRIAQLELCWPGEFQIMDQQSHRVVQTTIGPDRNKGIVPEIVGWVGFRLDRR